MPTRERPRRSSPLMKHDPFTLRVALDASGSARGELYLDDGESYAHEQGQIVWREFNASSQGKGLRLRSVDLVHAFPAEAVDGVELATYDASNAFAESVNRVKVERIVVLGLANKPTSIKSNDGRTLEWEYLEGVAAKGKKEGETSALTIKNPGVLVASDWDIIIS